MLWPLTETFHAIEPHLSEHLVSPAAFSDIKTIAHIFPDVLSAYFLECRLGAQTTQVDLLACAFAVTGARKILAGQDPTTDLPEVLLEHPLWRRVRNFCRQWAEPTSPLYNRAPLVWLEFDIDGPPPAIPRPSLHVCFDPRFGKQARQSHPDPLTVSEYQCIIENAFLCLLDEPLRSQATRSLSACFAALPTGGTLIHLSAMLSRNPMTLKVYSAVPQDQLFAYLRQVGWTYSTTEIEDVLTTFRTTTDIVRVELNIGPTLLPKIGIEFLDSSLPANDPRRKDLPDLCVAKGLCTPQKRDALVAWPGYSRHFCASSRSMHLKRWWDMKIIVQPDAPLEAKGYLGFMPGFSLF